MTNAHGEIGRVCEKKVSSTGGNIYIIILKDFQILLSSIMYNLLIKAFICIVRNGFMS